MFRSISNWLALPPRDAWRLLGLMLGLPIVSALLWSCGLVRTRRVLDRLSPQMSGVEASAGDLDRALRLAWLAGIAGRRGPFKTTCLRQAVLVHWLLRWRGLAPELKLGVRKDERGFAAHAWVELQGRSLDLARHDHVAFPHTDWTSSVVR